MGGNVDRNISEMLTPKIDWKEALREFVKSMTQGKDQSSWRRLHKRYLAADLIMPSSYSEKVGGITIAIDTSGSIGTEELSQFSIRGEVHLRGSIARGNRPALLGYPCGC
jgi:predicted metal-dependent peptidase